MQADDISPMIDGDIQPDILPSIKAEDKTGKYRFWLAFVALLLAGFMAFLALGALSAGEGLAEDLAPMMRGETLFTFRLLATGFFALIPACLWLAYKFRPGGR